MHYEKSFSDSSGPMAAQESPLTVSTGPSRTFAMERAAALAAMDAIVDKSSGQSVDKSTILGFLSHIWGAVPLGWHNVCAGIPQCRVQEGEASCKTLQRCSVAAANTVAAL